MVNIIKEELSLEESLKKKIEFICDFTKKIIKTKTSNIVFLGVLLIVLGIIISIISLITWKNNNFGDLNSSVFMPQIIIANSILIIGVQLIFSALLINVININIRND